MADKVDLEAIFKEVNVIASLTDSSIDGTGSFVQNGRVLPEAAKNDPSIMTWPSDAGRGPIGKMYSYTSHASDAGIASVVHISFLCTWDAGGYVTGQGGATYIENLHLYVAVPGGVGVSEQLTCSCSVGNAIMVDGGNGRTAQLEADMSFFYKQFHFLNIDHKNVKFTIRGDGWGKAEQVG